MEPLPFQNRNGLVETLLFSAETFVQYIETTQLHITLGPFFFEGRQLAIVPLGLLQVTCQRQQVRPHPVSHEAALTGHVIIEDLPRLLGLTFGLPNRGTLPR